jgi:hypothetical protein
MTFSRIIRAYICGNLEFFTLTFPMQFFEVYYQVYNFETSLLLNVGHVVLTLNNSMI